MRHFVEPARVIRVNGEETKLLAWWIGDDGIVIEVSGIEVHRLSDVKAYELDGAPLAIGEAQRELRLLDSIGEYTILDLPVVFTGSLMECREHAQKNGWKFKWEPNNLFNGYYVKDGEVLFIT